MESVQTFRGAPVGDIIDRKGGRIRRLADVHRALIVLQVVNAIGHGFAERILLKIMRVYPFWGTAPGATGVLEVADQLFLLGIDADHGLTRHHMLLALGRNVLKLGVTVRRLRASQLFTVGTEAVVMGLQEAANDRATDDMALDG